MRFTLLFSAPFLALVAIACGSAGDSTSSAGPTSGAGGETSGTASGGTGGKTTSSSGTASGGTASGGTASSGTAGTASSGTAGTASSGTAGTGSGTASTGSGTASTGSGTASSGSGTASTGSGTASTGTASTGSGTASSGTASGSSSSTGSGSSSSSGSGSSSSTGSNVCAGYIDVVGLGGSEHFTSICQGAWGSNQSTSAIGYHFAGGPFPGADEIDILGCTDTNATSAGIHFSARKAAAPGTFTDGDLSYVDGNGGTWGTTGEMYQVVITKLDAPGGVIEGTFSAKATGPADTTIVLTGSFHVCRVADELVP